MVKDNEKYLNKVSGVKKVVNSYSAMQNGMQVGKVTRNLADAIYRRFLIDKALQTGREFRTNTIENATTVAIAPATTGSYDPNRIEGMRNCACGKAGRCQKSACKARRAKKKAATATPSSYDPNKKEGEHNRKRSSGQIS
mmetsp:Transcript_10361/g.11815  ORF Transcript_10361/g.11815 Transcript_10361/m.11815 type:complete len:140 (+) Transcript_10361:2104-2523(+)